MSLATEIKEARHKLGLSQSQAAKAWDIPLGTLQGWEQEYRYPRGLALKHLRQILNAAMASPLAPAPSAKPLRPSRQKPPPAEP